MAITRQFVQVKSVQNFRNCEWAWEDKHKFAIVDEHGSTHTFSWSEFIKREEDKGAYRNDR